MIGTMNIVVVKAGREWPGVTMLDPGARIASRWYDPERNCHVIELLTPGVPASPEVEGAGRWDCDERGHRRVYGSGCCLECGDTYQR
jgi:hypothetical protein